MNIHVTNFINKCNVIFNDCITYSNNTISLQTNKDHRFTITSQEKDIISALQNYSNYKEADETTIYNDNYFEVLIAPGHTFHLHALYQELNIPDIHNKLTYIISEPSDEFIIHVINKIHSIATASNNKVYTNSFFFHQEHKHLSFLKGILEYLPPLKTLRITSVKGMKLSQFSTLSNSLRFTLSYNTGNVLIEQKSFDRFFITQRNVSHKITELSDLDPPKREYDQNLIHQYHLAMSADSSPLQFLSYYHIIEYFFESIYMTELTNNIKQTITSPNFSYNKDDDIRQLIKTIQRKLPNRQEAISINELEALKLCIKKYVDIEELYDIISRLDHSLIEYYKLNKVAFCEGPTIDFSERDTEKIISQLSRRIYATRNAIVHSKKNDQGKFTPFVDEVTLSREIPLIQNISEQVIIAESSFMSL